MSHINDQFNNLPIQFMSPDAVTNAYYNYDKVSSMASWILERIHIRPDVAIICGTGLGQIADLIENPHHMPYSEIPEFPRVTVPGHKGNLVFGHLNGMSIVCMQGRFHPYEGYSLALCSLPIKIFKLLGCKLVVLTNASGGLNPAYNVGDLVVIKDHFSLPVLNLQHPLIGSNDERFGPRFVAINNVYDKKLRDSLLECATETKIGLHEGVYGTIGGPSYETVTDGLFLLNAAKCDCVGMSTAHEAIVAAYCGLKVVAVSMVTDRVALKYDSADDQGPDHAEIVKVASQRAAEAEKLIAVFLKKLYDNTHLLL